MITHTNDRCPFLRNRLPNPRFCFPTALCECRGCSFGGSPLCPGRLRGLPPKIVPNLDYFHHRSANHVDFFCAGYGMYWEVFRESVPDMQVVAKVSGRDWLFSAKMFDFSVKRSNWRRRIGATAAVSN